MASIKKVTLAQLEVQRYRSCRATTFMPQNELSTLIGINGAGKTNILNAIRLLGLQSRVYLRSRDDAESSVNETLITAWFNVGKHRIGYRIRVHLAISSKNIDEITYSQEEWNFASLTNSKKWLSIPKYFLDSKGIKKSRLEMSRFTLQREMLFNKKILLADLPEFKSTFGDLLNNPEIINCATAILDFCQNISYYSASQFTDPSKCPSSFEIDSDNRLTESYRTSTTHIKFGS